LKPLSQNHSMRALISLACRSLRRFRGQYGDMCSC
jgi:hypothetical protein